MASDIITVIMDTVTAVFGGFGTGLSTLFETLIYESVNGLTDFATYMLVFLGFGIGMGVVTLLLRKVF